MPDPSIYSECKVKAMPAMCAGSLMVSSGGGYIYDSSARAYNIGKLQAIVPSYDPTNSAFADQTYNVQQKWTPMIYTISGGAITSTHAGSTTGSGGIICSDKGYNTRNTEYSLVSWYLTAVEGS